MHGRRTSIMTQRGLYIAVIGLTAFLFFKPVVTNAISTISNSDMCPTGSHQQLASALQTYALNQDIWDKCAGTRDFDADYTYNMYGVSDPYIEE